MNIKNALIIAAIAVLIVSALSFIFFKELMNENAPRTAPAIPAPGVVKEAAQASYTIPANAIPTIGQIEENVKKAKAEQASNNAMITKVQADSALNREKIRVQLEAQAAAPQETVNIPQGNTPSETRKVAANPTREERSQMKTRGVIAY